MAGTSAANARYCIESAYAFFTTSSYQEPLSCVLLCICIGQLSTCGEMVAELSEVEQHS